MFKKTHTLYYKELDEALSKVNEDTLQVGKNDLAKKLDIGTPKPRPNNEIIYRTKYRFNPKVFDDEYESKEEILIPMKYKYASIKQGNFLLVKTRKENQKKQYLQKIDENKIIELDEESENEDENKDNKDKLNKIKTKNELKEMFGEELIPPDDKPIGEPPIKSMDVSDIDMEEEDELEDDDYDINLIYNNKNQIIINSDSPEENNYQFTEHILNQVKSPLDMITIGEKIYELSSKKIFSNEKIDLSPLTTFKKKNNIQVFLYKFINMKAQYNQFLQNGKFSLIEYLSKEQKEEMPTTFALDNQDYKTNCSIWFGTNKGTLIKIPICNKPSKDCQAIVIDSEEKGISSLDIFENNIIMGHMNGTIQIWEGQKIIDKIKDVKSLIIQIKFIKINIKKKKYEFIYSDKDGNVKYVQRGKTLMGKNLVEDIYCSKEYPIYKICLFNKDNNLKINKKKNLIIALASLNNVILFKIRPKAENKRLALIEVPYSNVGDFVFDCDFGYGYGPISELNVFKEKDKKKYFSLIGNELIKDGKKESILFTVSYGEVILLFEINYKKNYSVEIIEIGHYIAESPICRLGFISKSYIIYIDIRKNLKIINTFCFEDQKFKDIHSPTKNEIISYESIDLSGFEFLNQYNLLLNDLSDEGKLANFTYNKYVNASLIFGQNIFIITKQKFLLYKLYRWDEVINMLCQEEQYIEMIWLTTFLLGKNKNLLFSDTEEINEKEFEISLQENLYIFLIKGIKKENNYKELRMFIEYCLKTGRFKDYYKAKEMLAQRKLDKYLYEYTSDYILNGDCSDFDMDIDFLKDFINYYISKNEIIFLSKILLKLNANSIKNPEILKILEDNEIINPFLYAKMKDKNINNIDYFEPIVYLYKLYEKKINREKLLDSENENKFDKSKQEYFKLMTEYDMKYYYDKALSCDDYFGHKLLWYINKCLNNEEYPNDNNFPKNIFEEICKKILLFLTMDKVMELLLKFDSFSYFQLLTKIFTKPKIYRLMEKDEDKNKFPYKSLEAFVKQYIGDDVPIDNLGEKYFFYQIKLFIDEKTTTYNNNYYIKYDFYQMTSLICNKRDHSSIFIDRGTMIDAIKFFINYETFLEGEDSKKYYDPFNCHKMANKNELLYKKNSEINEDYILYLLKCLQKNQDFFEADLDDLFLLEGLKNHNQIRAYLSEYGKKYDELFKVKLEEYYNKNPSFTKEENIKQLFKWINDTLALTKKLEAKQNKSKKSKQYYHNFKNFLRTQFLTLSKISVTSLYELIDHWYNRQLTEICFSIDSDSLKYIYINNYLFIQNQHDEKDKNYEQYLFMKLELLIKNNHKEQIIKILERNSILWKDKYLQFLIKNEVLDAAVFVSQKLENIESCINLSMEQIKKIFGEIKNILLNYNEGLNNDIIYLKFDEIKNYLDLSLMASASWAEVNRDKKDNLKLYWSQQLDMFYNFQNEIHWANKNNKLSLKFKSNNFNFIYEKVELTIIDNIGYILSKMNDYIQLSIIVDILSEKFKNTNYKDYSKMFQRMFSAARQTEDIFRTIFILSTNTIKKIQTNLLTEMKKGLFTESEECNYCNRPIYINDKTNKYEYFKCGHTYHSSCCPIEKGQYACYICRMEDLEKSVYTDIPNLIFRKKENVIKNEIIEQKKNKIIEVNKKDVKKDNLINKLRNLKNKKNNKIEIFKNNVENIKFKD